MPAIICHVDMDAFFASVEMRSDPRLLGRPMVVGGGPGLRGVVTTASYPARRFGVRSGMPLFQAFSLCPELIVVPVDPAKYIYESLRVLAVLDRLSPRVEAASIDEAYVAFPEAGLDRWVDVATQEGGRIKQGIRRACGLTASVGIAVNRLQAKMATGLNKPDGLTAVKPGTFLDTFADALVSAIPGVGPRTTQTLFEAGIRTIGDLASRPPGSLPGTFGRWGAMLQGQARGEDPRGSIAIGETFNAKSASHEITFARDVGDPRELRATIWMLADRVSRRLRRQELEVRTVAVRFKIGQRRSSRQHRMDIATDDPRTLAREAWDLLEASRSGRALRLVGVAGSGLESKRQGALPFPWEQKHRRLLETGDRLRDRFGEDAVLPGGMFYTESEEGSTRW
jgi:nucleotidyltransferase/DNA polymerase involved in DNA repair